MAWSQPYSASIAASLVFLSGIAVVSAESGSDETQPHRIYQGRAVRLADNFQVPLQPFSMDAPAKHSQDMRVAYYAPHAIPHAEPADEDDVDEVGPPRSESGPTVPGNRAVLRNGIAYAPANAPARVKSAIWAVNTIRNKPYHWGGGHGSLNDSGYDCSGTVSFALYHAGLLSQPLPSSDFLRYGERGRGRWITIYSKHGHTFAVIAGLRLDTTDFRYGRGSDVGPRWHMDGRSASGFEARHPAGF